MFQNLQTNQPNTHAKFELNWFSGFLKNGDMEYTDLWIYYQDTDTLSDEHFQKYFESKPKISHIYLQRDSRR